MADTKKKSAAALGRSKMDLMEGLAVVVVRLDNNPTDVGVGDFN